MKKGITDLAVIVISLLIIFGLAYLMYDKHGTSMKFDCIHANSTQFIAIFMSCPQVVDDYIQNKGWNISTFGDNKVYLWKQ